ncbi:hypothetical protein A2U01_0064556, partial [Trifolium medium]|nr:hypothetical protein [Trifolium medium]
RPVFNALGAAMSTLYLSMKYPLDNSRVGIVKGDHAVARRCYESSLKSSTRLQLQRTAPNRATERGTTE